MNAAQRLARTRPTPDRSSATWLTAWRVRGRRAPGPGATAAPPGPTSPSRGRLQLVQDVPQSWTPSCSLCPRLRRGLSTGSPGRACRAPTCSRQRPRRLDGGLGLAEERVGFRHTHGDALLGLVRDAAPLQLGPTDAPTTRLGSQPSAEDTGATPRPHPQRSAGGIRVTSLRTAYRTSGARHARASRTLAARSAPPRRCPRREPPPVLGLVHTRDAPGGPGESARVWAVGRRRQIWRVLAACAFSSGRPRCLRGEAWAGRAHAPAGRLHGTG